MSPFSRSCCAFGGSLPIKRSRETRPPSWSMVMIGSIALRSRRSSISFRSCRRAFDVSPEENEPARLHPSKKRRRLGIEFGSGHAGKDQLTR